MTYTTQTWTDWSGAPADAPVESRFTAERGNHMEAGIAAAHDALAGTTTGEPNKLLMLDDASRATGADAVDDDQYATLGQTKGLIDGSTGTAKGPVHATLATQPTVSSTAFIDLPDLTLTGLATGAKRRLNVILKYRGASGATTGGLAVRFKGGTTAVTNKLANPSFETDLTGWTGSSLATITRDTSLGGQDGSANLKVVISGASTSQQVVSEWVPVTPGDVSSGGIYARRVSATARTVRADMEYKNSAGDLLTASATNGLGVTPGTGSWTRAIVDSTHGASSTAPATATHRRLRVRILATEAGDEFHFDAAQIEAAAALPAYGSTGGSGSTVLDIDGAWHGLKLAGSSKEDYTRIESVRTAATADTTAKFGAIGTTEDTTLTGTFDITVGGTGLTDQVIALEFAQQGSSGTNTQLLSGSATFAVLDAAA